jgi:hypothetical protein
MMYESWNCDSPVSFPTRSYLYHLSPLGVGTELVESLTGYISRLAEAHSVPASVLVRRELIPRLRQESDTLAEECTVAQNYAFIYDSYVLNGISDCPRRWIRTLEASTGQHSLHVMTMLTWAGVISDLHLLRSNRAWCPQCFDFWRSAKLPVYEPLLWAIKVVAVCPIHERSLEERCPRCGRGSQALTAKARPGCCYRCRSWLGTPASHRPSATAHDAELTVAHSVGGMLALAASLPQAPSAVYFKDNLRHCIHEFAAGNHSHYARLSGVSFDSIERWLAPGSSIRLDSFLRMCCSLQLPAGRLLSEHMPSNDPGWERARHLAQQISSCARQRKPFYARPAPQGVTRLETSPSPETQESLRQRFERALVPPAPQALQTIAIDLGFNNSSSLYNRFPDLCRAMVLKNRRWRRHEDDRIRHALTKALEEHPAPSMKELAVRLGHTANALRSRFPELSAALAARIPERRLFEREHVREGLQSALELTPPASMKDVARLIGRDVNYLRVLFPGLCRQITGRYFDEKRRASDERRLRFCAEIRTAVIDLCERGVNPSRKRVFSAIVKPSMRCSHTLDAQIAQTLRELEIAPRGSLPSTALASPPVHISSPFGIEADPSHCETRPPVVLL